MASSASSAGRDPMTRATPRSVGGGLERPASRLWWRACSDAAAHSSERLRAFATP